MAESSTSAATCKVCGHRHSMRDPHMWDAEPEKAVLTKLKAVMANAPNMANKCMANVESMANIPEFGKVTPPDIKPAPERQTTYKYRDIDNRRAYQRDYMRKRRSGKS